MRYVIGASALLALAGSAWAAAPWVGEGVAAHVVADASPDSSLGVLVSVLDSASRSIHISVYELNNPAIEASLARALERGVEVVVLLEGTPIPKLPEGELELSGRLAARGAKIFFYDRARDSSRGRRTFRYLHAKYSVVDGARVVVGSANYGLNGHPQDNTFGNREWNVVLDDSGPAGLFEAAFEHDLALRGEWAAYGSSPRYRAGEGVGEEYSFVTVARGGTKYTPHLSPFEAFNVPVRTVFAPDNSGPDGPLVQALSAANQTVDVEQLNVETYWGGKPYNPDLQDSPMVAELLRLARAGKRVRLLLNNDKIFKKVDDSAGDAMGWLFGADPLDASPDFGERAFEFGAVRPRDNAATLAYLNGIAQNENLPLETRLFASRACGLGVLHNKGMVVDGEISFVGSLNWGESAMKLNREAGVLLKDVGIARFYSSAFEGDWTCSAP